MSLMATQPVHSLLAPSRRAVLHRRVRWLVAATIAYNLAEAAVAISAGAIASSTALLGFGLDSLIEVSSAAAVAWQFASPDPQRRERTALCVIAGSFFALAAYITAQAAAALAGRHEARPSTPGLVLAGCSVLVMPTLSHLQRRAGRELGSRTAVADSKQTLLCTYLSAILLAGLAVNLLLGWAWADPIAALAIAAIAAREGWQAWHGQTCCPTPAASPDTEADKCECGPDYLCETDGNPAPTTSGEAKT
jgi:divalent metal cation (Fe/Co/Zn/Cd) transporter